MRFVLDQSTTWKKRNSRKLIHIIDSDTGELKAEWRIHRDGLQRMIDARGGIAALQSNWRLGLVTSL
jgi:hypothetical protein